jgi:hypothetical protein
MNDLDLKLGARDQMQLISKVLQELRLKKCQNIVKMLKKGKSIILFLDEKVFQNDSVSNSCLNRSMSSVKMEEVREVQVPDKASSQCHSLQAISIAKRCHLTSSLWPQGSATIDKSTMTCPRTL